MNILFEISNKDLIFIGLAFVALVIFGIIIYYVVSKSNRVMPIAESDRFDAEDEEEPKILTEEQKKAKAELERLYSKMSQDLEKQQEPVKQETEINDIDEFEREQEENAIISYQELMRQANMKQKIEEKKDERRETEKEPKYKTISEYEKEIRMKNEKEQLRLEIDEEEPKKFKNSEIISPIFGIQSEGRHVQRPPMKQKTTQEKTSEPKNNEDFLKSLKEFRKKL